MTQLEPLSHRELFAAGQSDLTVTADAAVRVLRQVHEDPTRERLAQRWASLILRGYLDQGSAPIVPLTIEIDPTAEAALIEALNRLADLGDVVDGQISTDELDDLIESLGHSSISR